MNEEELKEIWQRGKTTETPVINFERMQKNLLVWQASLRRKIKLDIATNVLGYVLLIPAFIIYPKTLYFSPLMVIVWVWYLWETLRIYRQETNFAEPGNTKEYLVNKKRFIENYISRTRYIIYLTAPFSALAGLYIPGYLEEIWRRPLILAAILIFCELLIIIVVELYVKKVYAPSIKELKNLLQQLNFDE